MKTTSKVLTLAVLLTTSLFANVSDDNVLKFEKKRISQNPNVEVENISINTKKELPVKGWYGYIIDVEAKIEDKIVNAKDIIFSDGRYISLDLLDSTNGKSLKDLVTPEVTSKYYDKAKLIAGNHNAKDKIVIFSDPLCPFCMDYVPEVIKHVNKNKDSIALYYYHFPLLRLHPAADPLSKLMELGKEKGIKDIELKVYETDWDEYFTSKESDVKKVITGFNKVFKTSFTQNDIESIELIDAIENDMALGEEVMVQGTPTIFVNGEKDTMRTKYEKLGKNK
ncbi:DsbA family protein [Poseidonibacter ostreae]|jgi:thiol:disulfide interchange protein DsbC|uniref:Thioredoxin domain-containing protein n=1 Tax=Poseidonibacter ostreae TaxID=2654171 RepID=A0A6L4WRP6_9BACT|nr:thioredoxin domain-containing protein [Poseidonibacter ostreae]KAB7887531.1 thioredoxin domain-containing protein [Poseidonibacter ostreae]KAB7888410.1 thioredoxin domain-containing protein [Poseidonibacter ostreae]KAB7889133.1 thioredoxin domain-containing protein [Poseidonibacter ostreae]MAC83169.1 disulfide bond formation protein DsbA [Arcobacter sp.]|tara:strand:- start:3598 stop:4440 length:843 start_codon:yes stop_codon:yes gene_type:complete